MSIMLFIIVISIVILQRLIELLIAKRNEKRMLRQGAYEVGAAHYPMMVAMHIAFFVSLITETMLFGRPLSALWGVFFGIFLVAQLMRIWCLISLGRFWNTKIIILPQADVVRKGPYKWIRHPNYLIVTTEILLLPLMFSSYFTAIIFSLLNGWMLAVRIPAEETALREATNYDEKFSVK